MNHSRRETRRYFGALTIGTVGGVLATLVVLRTTGLMVPLNLAGSGLRKFEMAYEALYTNYYKPLTSNHLFNGAVQGMVDSTQDPFTDYFPPVGQTAFQNTLSNAYVGIGTVVQEQNGALTIQSVIANSPAAKAGLKSGDEIVSVNGTSIRGMTVDQAVGLIQGPVGKSVSLTVVRGGAEAKPEKFTVTRERITAPEVYPKMLDHHIGYIRFSIVGQNAASEFKGAVTQLVHQGAQGLIIDVRGNPGGYLDQALGIASFLLPKGDVVVQIQQRTGGPQVDKSKGPGLNLPMVVMMDDGTASAAEILSAALHDDLGTPLVGTRSFGKGTAQTEDTYPDGSGMKYTVAKWLTPKGNWINKVGLKPSVPVNLPSFASLSPIDNHALPLEENQVSTAVETLQKTLAALGYHADRTDGYFDASTRAEVAKFQRGQGLSPTGVVDASTANALNNGLNRLIEKSDTQLAAAKKVLIGRTSGKSVEK